jgi:hypothetical protein
MKDAIVYQSAADLSDSLAKFHPLWDGLYYLNPREDATPSENVKILSDRCLAGLTTVKKILIMRPVSNYVSRTHLHRHVKEQLHDGRQDVTDAPHPHGP